MKIILSQNYKFIFESLMTHPPVEPALSLTKDHNDSKKDVEERMRRRKRRDRKKKKIYQLNLLVDDIDQEDLDVS